MVSKGVLDEGQEVFSRKVNRGPLQIYHCMLQRNNVESDFYYSPLRRCQVLLFSDAFAIVDFKRYIKKVKLLKRLITPKLARVCFDKRTCNSSRFIHIKISKQ